MQSQPLSSVRFGIDKAFSGVLGIRFFLGKIQGCFFLCVFDGDYVDLCIT